MNSLVRDLGQRLKDTRESQGLSLDEVADRTKIRTHYLKALENGEWDFLPGDVYARGFVRSYADVLGMDGQALLAELDAQVARMKRVEQSAVLEPQKKSGEDRGLAREDGKSEQKSAGSDSQQQRNQSGKSGQRDGKPSRRLLAWNGTSQAAVVIVGLALIAAGAYVLNHGHGMKKAPGTGAVTATVPPSTSVTGTATPPTSPLTTSSTQSSSPKPPKTSTAAKTYTSASSNFSVTPLAFQNGQMTYRVSSPQTMLVTVTATSANGCWLEVQDDGTVVNPSLLLASGTSRSWTSSHSMLIRVGNVPGASVKVDGHALTLPDVKVPINVLIERQSS
ncbi:RodZ domain-containing protein [Alicyclobacillus sp. SP_1]|uniref:RodZ domain-containing protein n=1 Tax=Alicyclobacillus sp. SP_1 TaxID=2942475 RepID=UPI00215860CC|nr:RodZ domain-containing protein [Alicyclobacillus sp. SP_1]